MDLSNLTDDALFGRVEALAKGDLNLVGVAMIEPLLTPTAPVPVSTPAHCVPALAPVEPARFSEPVPAVAAPEPAAENPAGGPSTSRRIPKWVEDIVWRRDGGRCAYLGSQGRRCGETAWLELDHVVPWARGGRSDDPGNIRLLCRAHNQSEAAILFGILAARQ